MIAWFKYHHDTPYDSKWDGIARRAGCTYRDVLAVWNVIMTEASKSDDRGSVKWFNAEHVADALRWDERSVEAVFEAMRGVVHDGLRLKSWERRQKADDTAPLRQRRKRDRDRSEYSEKCASTHDSLRHGGSRDAYVACHETREEETREEDYAERAREAPNVKTPGTETIEALRRLLYVAVGAAIDRDSPLIHDLSPIVGLLSQGAGLPCDLHADVIPAIRKCAAGKPPRSIRSWGFFVHRACENRDRRLAGAPASQPLQETNHGARPHRPGRIEASLPNVVDAAARAVERYERRS